MIRWLLCLLISAELSEDRDVNTYELFVLVGSEKHNKWWNAVLKIHIKTDETALKIHMKTEREKYRTFNGLMIYISHSQADICTNAHRGRDTTN